MSAPEPTEAQVERLNALEARHPATHFRLLETRPDGSQVREWEDLASAGTFVLAPDGHLLPEFLANASP